MICVSIGRTRHKMMAAQHRHLAEKGAELVELRVDWLRNPPDIGRLLKDRPTPVVLTCRRNEDKGRWRGDEARRLAMLREGIVSGVEYVDLEVDIADSIPRYGDTKRIVSYHNFDETPLHLPDIYEELTSKDADIIKLVTTANTPGDNARVLDVARRAKVPTIAFCMGELGTVSRLLCGRYGAPFTYATFSKEREMAPGQLSFAEMRNLYRFDSITEATKVFAVVGDPVAHSLSPLIHNAAFRKTKTDAVYIPMRVPEGQLIDSVDELNELDINGYSVTIPHKEDAAVKGQADSLAREIGAANTLFKLGGDWQNTNTDCSAAMEVLEEAIARKEGQNASMAGRRALVLGAGGVARGIGYGLVKAGAIVLIANRTRKRAEALAGELGCQQIGWENRGSEHADIVVNCTSVGMHPEMDETPFEPHWLRENAIAFDTVYTPENTLFLKGARERGCPTISGVEMFVRQAAKQFEIFTGQIAPIEYMEETLRRGISAANQ